MTIRAASSPHLRRLAVWLLWLGTLGVGFAQDSGGISQRKPLEGTATAKQGSAANQEPATRGESAPQVLSSEELIEASTLIEKLNSSSFDVRESATRELNDLDGRFLPMLRTAFDESKSPEAKARLIVIVRRKEKARQEEINREFLRVTHDDDTSEFLGWKSFSAACGFHDRKTKAIFLQMLDFYPWLVYEEIPDSKDAMEKASRVAHEIMTRQTTNLLYEEDAIAMVYTLALCEESVEESVEDLAHRLFSLQSFSTRLTNLQRSATSQSSNAIVVFYNKFAQNAVSKSKILFSGLNGQIPISGRVAAKYLLDDSAIDDPEAFELAMLCLAQFGKPEDAPSAERWLRNTNLVRPSQTITSGSNSTGYSLKRISVEARDMALATTILLHGDSPYLFFPEFRPHPLRAYTTESVGYESETPESARDAVLARWLERVNTKRQDAIREEAESQRSSESSEPVR